MYYSNSGDAKKAGQKSRRHETNEQRDAAREARRQRLEAKLDAAKQRQTLASERPPREQLRLLDARLGVGVGAVRERTRLAVLIAAS
jgi:hypothetical protein